MAAPSILHHSVVNSISHPPFPLGALPAHAEMFSAMAPSHRLSSYPTTHFNHPVTYTSGMPMPISSSPMPINRQAPPTSSSPPLPPSSGKSPFQFSASQTHPHSQLSSSYTPTPQPEYPYYSQPQPSPASTSTGISPKEPRTGTLEKEVQTMEVQTSEQFILALREATSLYQLPHSTLEKLIGDVVREDGFVNLVCDFLFRWFNPLTSLRWKTCPRCGG